MGQDRTCCTEKGLPQAQFTGTCAGSQPYLREMASLNALLRRVKPCSSIGRTVSQLEAPFSFDKSIANWREEGRDSLKLSALAFKETSLGLHPGFGRQLLFQHFERVAGILLRDLIR